MCLISRASLQGMIAPIIKCKYCELVVQEALTYFGLMRIFEETDLLNQNLQKPE